MFPPFHTLPLWLKLVVAGLILAGCIKFLDYSSTVEQILQGM
jgi:hypothetical protein